MKNNFPLWMHIRSLFLELTLERNMYLSRINLKRSFARQIRCERIVQWRSVGMVCISWFPFHGYGLQTLAVYQYRNLDTRNHEACMHTIRWMLNRSRLIDLTKSLSNRSAVIHRHVCNDCVIQNSLLHFVSCQTCHQFFFFLL